MSLWTLWLHSVPPPPRTVSSNQNPSVTTHHTLWCCGHACPRDHIKVHQGFCATRVKDHLQLLSLTQLPRATGHSKWIQPPKSVPSSNGSNTPSQCHPAKPCWMYHSRDANSHGVICKRTWFMKVQFLSKQNVNDSGQNELHKNLGKGRLTSVLPQAAALEDASVCPSPSVVSTVYILYPKQLFCVCFLEPQALWGFLF